MKKEPPQFNKHPGMYTITTTPNTPVREDLEKSVTTTKFNDHPCVWIPLDETAAYIDKLRAADRAYLAGEIHSLWESMVEIHLPVPQSKLVIFITHVLAIINGKT